MQRTQIYFENSTLQELKEVARASNISVSEFIRRVMKVELKKQKKNSLNTFLAEMQPVESFADVDAVAYVQDLRSRSRIVGE